MKKFEIITDSCSELDLLLRQKYDIDYIPMHMSLDGKEYPASLDWEDFPVKTFYQLLRDGKRFLTAQITKEEYVQKFEPLVKDGLGVLYVACSSGLSASIKASLLAKEELTAKYPNAEIHCIDSLMAGSGLGSLCISASKMREQGIELSEIAKWVEEKKWEVNQECTVEKLTYLKQAGRVSAAAAFFGGLLSIKPIIISDAKGHNFALEKVKGRKNSLDRVAERFVERYRDVPYQDVCISHADCEEDAFELKRMIEEKMGKPLDARFSYIGPIVGGASGPGTVAIYFYGQEVTVNKD